MTLIIKHKEVEQVLTMEDTIVAADAGLFLNCLLR